MIVNVNGYNTAKVWKQERLIARLTSVTADVKLWTNIEGSSSSPIATYTPTSAGVCLIDLTDYVRANPTVTAFNFSFGLNNYVLSVSMMGLINPESVLIPDNMLTQYGALITPPSMMICAMDHGGEEQAEFYATSGTWTVDGQAQIDVSKRYIGNIDGVFTISDGTHTKKFVPRAFKCGVEYALVKWISFTGIERIHWFEVMRKKTTAVDSYSILPIDNEYIQIKGREDGFQLRLTGLNMYDLWYYADILTSSKVEVSVNGSNNRVEVETKNITIPDGEAFDGKLEINVNWKRYDAVAM